MIEVQGECTALPSARLFVRRRQAEIVEPGLANADYALSGKRCLEPRKVAVRGNVIRMYAMGRVHVRVAAGNRCDAIFGFGTDADAEKRSHAARPRSFELCVTIIQIIQMAVGID